MLTYFDLPFTLEEYKKMEERACQSTISAYEPRLTDEEFKLKQDQDLAVCQARNRLYVNDSLNDFIRIYQRGMHFITPADRRHINKVLKSLIGK